MSAGIGINGFGRIGRTVFRILIEKGLRIGAINDPSLTPKQLAYLLKYDSVHGTFEEKIQVTDDGIEVNCKNVTLCSEKDPDKIPWKDFKADYVVDASGKFTKVKQAGKHKAKKVLISSPSKDAPMYVLGVNTENYDHKAKVVSMASCTTNGLAPLLKVLHKTFHVQEGLMTTIHSATQSQNVLDGISRKNWRVGRCSLNNIIPTSTGASKAIFKIFPELDGKLMGMAFRVPVPNVSLIDLSVRLTKSCNYEDIKGCMMEASRTAMKGILGYTDEQVVSSDLIGTCHSVIFDADASSMLNNKFAKIIGWYDNEYGYSCRIVDFLLFMMEQDGKRRC